mgnify:CR=1 FL=1
MTKKVKIFIVSAIILVMTVCFVGCSSGKTTNNSNSSNGTPKQDININDISWNVDEGIVDGDRYVVLNYTNNTQYTIAEFEIKFKEKSDITEEERESFRSYIKKNFDLSDEDMEGILSLPISMHAETKKVVNPGASVSNIRCFYFTGSHSIKDIRHYNLVEPDIATIKYINENKIYTVYYDYGSKKYSTEENSEIAYQWSQTDLGNKIPKPDVKLIEVGRDDESDFTFDAYGLSLDQFNAYIEKCKELGYTVEPKSFEGFYSADNAKGYKVRLSYHEYDCSMYVVVSAPESDNK